MRLSMTMYVVSTLGEQPTWYEALIVVNFVGPYVSALNNVKYHPSVPTGGPWSILASHRNNRTWKLTMVRQYGQNNWRGSVIDPTGRLPRKPSWKGFRKGRLCRFMWTGNGCPPSCSNQLYREKAFPALRKLRLRKRSRQNSVLLYSARIFILNRYAIWVAPIVRFHRRKSRKSWHPLR